ncbi:DUF559 domain-containing protein [Aquimarina sp. 2201CG5-10]|uniref:DUF559 domain-containing protein n=1 Tax=Aquimarina callyspongiae TaxID=3098150 RepID=UPI002AB3B6F9|nr:DUF559 domain-containing protein [Aquimarina sp. 2201CG5-10]MDY8136591.1 DUF559 domain-containing protein [Aquimarina sp. 2201CG5-10]
MSSQIVLHQPVSEKIIRHSLDNSISSVNQLHQKLKEKGYHFLRDHKNGNYCFDFYNPQLKIAIEIDGYAHEFSDVYSNDKQKRLYIHSLGITVLRFTDYQILTDIEEILRAIKNQIKHTPELSYVV